MSSDSERTNSSSSLFFTSLDEHLQLGHWHALLVSVLGLLHGLLDDACDFLSRLGQHFVHILGHWVALAEVLGGRLGCLGVRIQGGLVLLEEFLLNGDVVVRDAQDD